MNTRFGQLIDAWKLWSLVVSLGCFLFLLIVTADARPRGQVGSTTRAAHCVHEESKCARDGKNACNRIHSDKPEQLLSCYDGVILTCSESKNRCMRETSQPYPEELLEELDDQRFSRDLPSAAYTPIPQAEPDVCCIDFYGAPVGMMPRNECTNQGGDVRPAETCQQ